MSATSLAPVANPGITGVSVAGVACDTGNGNTFPGRCLLLVRNTGVGARTVTFTTPADADGNAVADPAVAVASGAVMLIGPFKPGIYGASPVATGSHAELYFTALEP